MKHKGSYFEYEEQRNRNLMRIYRECLRTGGVPRSRIYHYIVKQPAMRYWVSEERAYFIISRMLEGKSLRALVAGRNKRRMFEDILQQVEWLNEMRPHATLYELVFEVVNSPAPEFYLSPGSAKVIISKIRNGFYDKRKKPSPIARLKGKQS